jgi:hypothetical protein
VSTSYTITPGEFLAAKRLHTRTTSLVIRLAVVMLCVGLAAAKQYTAAVFLLVTGVMLAGGLIGICLGSRWDDWRFMRQYRQNPELQSSMTLALVDNDLVITTDKSTTALPRERILKVRSNSQVTLLYRSSAMFHVIPTRVLTPDIAAFLGMPAPDIGPRQAS